MAGILIRWLILTAAILAASYLVDGIVVTGFWAAFFAAAILGLLNVFFKPLLIILTLPVNILTLGLFTLVINGVPESSNARHAPDFLEIEARWADLMFGKADHDGRHVRHPPVRPEREGGFHLRSRHSVTDAEE